MWNIIVCSIYTHMFNNTYIRAHIVICIHASVFLYSIVGGCVQWGEVWCLCEKLRMWIKNINQKYMLVRREISKQCNKWTSKIHINYSQPIHDTYFHRMPILPINKCATFGTHLLVIRIGVKFKCTFIAPAASFACIHRLFVCERRKRRRVPSYIFISYLLQWV